MRWPKIFKNRRFTWVSIAVGIFALLLVIINLFIIGGDKFIFALNSSLNTPLAILVVICAVSVWRMLANDKQTRLLWFSFLAGWILWALAETIWTVFSLLGKEVPYPSPADLFWILGYLPILIGLVIRNRTIPMKPNWFQRLLMWGLSLAVVIITVIFVLAPIIRDFDPQRLIECIINLAYPLLDLLVVVVVLRLLFMYEEGDFGFCWRLLALGFVFMTVSDLLFTYSTWQGTYYPDMQANLISRMGVDVPYTLAYLVWFTGLYALSILYHQAPAPTPGYRLRMVRTYGHILIFTRSDDTVIDVSPNSGIFFTADQAIGKKLSELLPIPDQDMQTILEALHREGTLSDLPVQIQDHQGELHKVSISGLAVQDSKVSYAGSNIVLRMRTAETSFDDPLTQESRALTRNILLQSGSHYLEEIGQFLADYYLAQVQSLFDMASHEGGETMAQVLLDKLFETSREHNWKIQFNRQTVLDYRDYPVSLLRAALPTLFETARVFLSQVTDPQVIETRLKEIRSTFSETALQDIERYGKTESDIWFSDHRRS